MTDIESVILIQILLDCPDPDWESDGEGGGFLGSLQAGRLGDLPPDVEASNHDDHYHADDDHAIMMIMLMRAMMTQAGRLDNLSSDVEASNHDGYDHGVDDDVVEASNHHDDHDQDADEDDNGKSRDTG